MLKNVSFKCKENDRREDRVFCCCAPCRREIGFFRVPFFAVFHFLVFAQGSSSKVDFMASTWPHFACCCRGRLTSALWF